MEQIKEGDYIRGFMPKDCMFIIEEKYIGLIAEVIKIVPDNTLLVKFSDGLTWWYNITEAIEHLCTQDMIDFEKALEDNHLIGIHKFDVADPLEETPFHKPDFSHLREMIEKGIDIRFESKSVNDLKLESLKRNQQETLFSVYLSLGKVRIIYIDQTEEDVRTHQKNNPNWHIIVVKQEQDKGIQIVIKE